MAEQVPAALLPQVGKDASGLIVRGTFLGHEEREYIDAQQMRVQACTVAVLCGLESVKVEFRTLALALTFFGGRFPAVNAPVELGVTVSAYFNKIPVRVNLRAQ